MSDDESSSNRAHSPLRHIEIGNQRESSSSGDNVDVAHAEGQGHDVEVHGKDTEEHGRSGRRREREAKPRLILPRTVLTSLVTHRPDIIHELEKIAPRPGYVQRADIFDKSGNKAVASTFTPIQPKVDRIHVPTQQTRDTTQGINKDVRRFREKGYIQQPGAGIVNSAHGVGPKHKRGPK